MKRLLISLILLMLAGSAFATNYTVKSGGGGSFTTIAACTSQMSTNGTGVADTCTVFAGTYSESVTVPAGSVGNYKTITVNGSDVVTVTGSITMSSHTKVNGLASTGCFSLAYPTGSLTDAYITNNQILSGCSSNKIEVGAGATYIYIQGNTLAGPCGGCDGIRVQGSHVLIENNDISRYRLAVNCYCSFTITRNNTFHDQFETDSNQHTDAWFSEPDSFHTQAAHYNVIEGNYQTNAIGPNAKGFLFQGDSCAGNCSNAIVRFNSAYHIQGTYTTNDATVFNFIKEYNNTWVDTRIGVYNGYFTDYYTNSNASDLNSIFYYPAAVANFNPYACDSSVCGTMNYGHALLFCTGGCSNIFGHQYNTGSFLSDPGNKITDPLFVNYSTQNYNLQSGSPAIATGTSLTTVAAGDSGSGTSLVVTDASYFQDSMGLSNPNSTVQGDCVSVGTVSNHVCVTAVNYSTNTLTLAGSITRSNGNSVWLYSKSDGVQVLTGSAPDMGALPFSGIIPLVGCGPTIFYGPPNYPCGSPSTTNPGQVTYYFQSTNPQWTGNTSNGAISPCTANCMQWVSGDQFLTSWQTGVGAGNGGNILLGGGVGHVNTSGTAITWVDGTPFSTAWSGTMTIAGVARTLVSCTSATACTVTVTPGTLTGAGYSVKGTAYGVSVWNSATVATLMSAPGTQTGVQMLDQTACKLITALDHTPAFGCQNAVSHDPTLPGYVSGSNLITQIADQGSSVNGLPVGNLTPSGGDNDRIWSKPNGTYLWIVNSGGSAQPMQLSTASGYVQVVNSSTACPGYVPPSIPSAMSTGWLSDTRYYYAANGTQIFQGDLTGTGCTLAIQASPTMLVDVEAAGVCPGIPSGLTLSGIMGVGGNGSGTILDDTFTMGLNYAGGQGHGDWIVSWSRTRGCWTANLHTGQVWAFCTSSCTSSTPALGTMATGSTNCWGLDGSTGNGTHDQQTDGLGIYVFVSSDDSNGYTEGGCTGTTEALIQLQIGTLNNFWTDSVTLGGSKVIGNHQMVGITNIVSNAFAAMTYSPMNNLPAYVTYANFPLSNGAPVHDIHQGLVEECTGLGSYSDSPCPIIGNTDTVLSTQLSGCTGSGAFVAAVYCPTAYSNMLTVMFPFGGFPSPLLTFAHSGSCGGISNGCADQIPSGFGDIDSIGVPSPKGDIFCWSSTMWHQLGYDRNVAPADEAFCMYFGQPKLAIAPATGLFAHVTKNFNAHFPISGGSK